MSTLPTPRTLYAGYSCPSDTHWLTYMPLQRWAEVVAADPEIGPDDMMLHDCCKAFKSLWGDAGVQLAIRKGNEYALHDNLT